MDRASVISIILHFSPLGCICKTKNHNFAGLTGLPSQPKCLQLSLPLSQFQHCKIIGIIGRPRKQLVLSLLHSWELYALTCLRATHPQRPHTSAAAIQKAQKTYASGSTKQPLHFTGSPFSKSCRGLHFLCMPEFWNNWHVKITFRQVH